MKRILGASAFLTLILVTATASAQTHPQARYDRQQYSFDNRLLDDVVEMTREQMPESSILSFLHARRSRLSYDVSAQDLIRLHRAGVSDRVVDYIASVVGIDEENQGRHQGNRAYEGEGTGEDGNPADPDPGTDIVAEPGPYGGDGGWGGWYGGWGPYWDPWWYGGATVIYSSGHSHGHGHGGHGHHSDNGSHGGSHGGTRSGSSRAYSGGGSHGGGGHYGGGGSHGGGHGGGGRH